MKRYTLVEYDQASPQVREIYDDFLRTTQSTNIPIWVKSLGGNKDLLFAYWERTKGSLATGSLPNLLKEMVIFVVSIENGSRYCSACHAHAVLSLDSSLKFEDLTALAEVHDSIILPDSYRVALKFTKRVAQDPNCTKDEHFQSLHDAGFDSNEVAELLSVINLAVMFNNYAITLRLPIDADYKPVIGAQ